MKLLENLTMQIAPSGNEKNVRDLIIKESEGYVDEVTVDTLGNLILRKKGSGKKLMFSAHMDEIGLIATVIEEEGFVRFSNIGSVNPNTLRNVKVKFTNGAIGIVIEQSGENADNTSKISDMYIDVFSSCKGNELNNVFVGDAATFAPNFDACGDFISTKSLDDRIGCYILIKAIKEIKNNKNDLYFVFTVQKELNSRGAKTAVNSVSPDYAITVDVTDCDDIPNGGKCGLKLGEGPAVKIKDGSIMSHPFIKNMIIDAAEELGIKHQFEIVEKKGTDAGAIQTSGIGVVTGGISIPVRYLHTPCETANINDANDAVKIITELVNNERYWL